MAPGASALDLLARGAVSLKGRMPWSSNATFLVECALDAAAGLAVYKPLRGERPLWDFPPGLYRREIAAYRLSEALGWRLVPPTVGREGPLGEGSLQLFVAADFEQHYFTLLEHPEHGARLRRICVLDLLLNNADRKSGHCLLDEGGVIWAIDNGLSFHVEEKLRTVIWDFGGESIPVDLLADVQRLLDDGSIRGLADLLAPEEERALAARARGVIKAGRFPVARGARRYPWPLV